MKQSKWKEILTSNQMFIVYIIVVLCIAISMKTPAFAEVSTIITLARALLVTLCFAICEMVVIISGGIDVSFPAIACASLYIPICVFKENDIDNVVLAFVFAAAIGLVIGIINAVLISLLQIPPLIATLGVSSITQGMLLTFFGTRQISRLPSTIAALNKVYLFTYQSKAGNNYSMTALILVPIILYIVVYIVLKYTMLGRGIYAIGGDANAARISGFNVVRLQFIVYIFSGVMAGIAGMIYCVLNKAANPLNLMGSEMMIIAAVVVGGTRMSGGHGTVLGTILGVVLIGLIQNNLIMLGVPTYWQTFVVGAVIVVGTAITSLKELAVQKNQKV